MKLNTKAEIHGELTIREIDRRTGDVVNEYGPNHNVITNEGMSLAWKRFIELDTPTHVLESFRLGDDYGSDDEGYSLLEPQDEDRELTSKDQTVVYRVPREDMVISYPDANTMVYATLLDGDFILDTYFPGEVDMRYCSATLRFLDGTTFSYKRFPVRSLSRLIDVQIIWTYTLTDSASYVCR